MKTCEKIKKIRKEKGFTQKKLGEKTGIAESTIRRYEIGLLNPKLETIKKIADALESHAEETGLSLTAIVEKALKEYLSVDNKKRK